MSNETMTSPEVTKTNVPINVMSSQAVPGLKLTDKLRIYERKVVASIIHSKQVGQYAVDNNLDYRFFPTYEKIMKIFSSLSNGTVEPTAELVISQLDLSNEREKETLLQMLNELKEDVVELEDVKVYLQMLKKQYKISRYFHFAIELQQMVETEKINPLNAEFDELDKEIDFKFSRLLEEYSKSDRIDMGMSQGYEHLLEDVEESLHSESKQVVTTGYEEVDRVYNGGNLKGTYTIYAGRPAMG